MIALGYNYRMTDLQAALGISQMKKIDTFIEKRSQLANYYNELLVDTEIGVPYQLPNTASGWHLYSVQLPQGVDRKEVFDRMRTLNIGVHVHYIPVYWHPYYQALGYEKGLCPKAEKWYEQALTLPLHQQIEKNKIFSIIDCLKKEIVKHDG